MELNQSEKGKYNPNSVWINQTNKKFSCVNKVPIPFDVQVQEFTSPSYFLNDILQYVTRVSRGVPKGMVDEGGLTNFCPPFQHLLFERLMSLGIMGAPRVPPLNPSETIVL